ncbi:MAG: hypothetical protein CSA05_00760 [Bacteroidia bacterium]|nr:MAG: hypothetical protein CSA05_00760 [Bacteroidia bacterium]
MNITKKIEALRAEKGWSVAKLARESDIPTVSLRVMLSRDNVNNYNVLALKKIADCLGTTVSELTKEAEEEKVKPQLSKKQMAQLQEIIKNTIENFFENENQQNYFYNETGEIVDDS